MEDIKEIILAGWRESDPAFPSADSIKDKIRILNLKTVDRGVEITLTSLLIIPEGIYMAIRLESPSSSSWKIEGFKIHDEEGNLYTPAQKILYKDNIAYLKLLPPYYLPCRNLFFSFNTLFLSSQKDVRLLLEEADQQVNRIIDGELEKGIEMGLSPEEVSRKLKTRSREMVTRLMDEKQWIKREGKWNWTIHPGQNQGNYKGIKSYKCERIPVHRKIPLQKSDSRLPSLWVEHITLYREGFSVKIRHDRDWINSMLKYKIRILYPHQGKEKISPLLILREEFFDKSAFLYFPVSATGGTAEYILNNISIEAL